MPMDGCRYGELINNLNMKALDLFRAVTLLFIGLSQSGNPCFSTEQSNRRLARKQFDGFGFASGFRRRARKAPMVVIAISKLAFKVQLEVMMNYRGNVAHRRNLRSDRRPFNPESR